jgi:hypothetical protein
MLGVAMFEVDGLGPEHSIRFNVDHPVPSIHAPMFRDDGSHVSRIVVCKQDDPRLTWFLLFHELLHSFCWLFHLPPRAHFWIDKVVRNQVLDTPCPPEHIKATS